jgi:hypothetical protein
MREAVGVVGGRDSTGATVGRPPGRWGVSVRIPSERVAVHLPPLYGMRSTPARKSSGLAGGGATVRAPADTRNSVDPGWRAGDLTVEEFTWARLADTVRRVMGTTVTPRPAMGRFDGWMRIREL